jgi:hypothetical protein
MAYSHPIARIITCTRSDAIIRTQINLDRTEGTPIAPASLWIGDPPREKDAHPILELHRLVSRAGNIFEFESSEKYHPQPQLPTDGFEGYFVRWWSPNQLALAHSDAKVFKRYRFIAKSPEDHDHCEFCWKHICEYDHGDQEAYTNGDESVCFECYDKYITSGFGKFLGEATYRLTAVSRDEQKSK